MNVCVHVYVCIYVYVYVCLCVCVSVCLCVICRFCLTAAGSTCPCILRVHEGGSVAAVLFALVVLTHSFQINKRSTKTD